MPCVPRSRSASQGAFKVASGKEKLSNLLSRVYVFTYISMYIYFIQTQDWFPCMICYGPQCYDSSNSAPNSPRTRVCVVTRVWLELVSTACGRWRPQIHKPTASKRQNNTATGQVSIKWFMRTELHLNPLNHHVHLSHNQGSPQIPRRVVERIRKMTCKQLSWGRLTKFFEDNPRMSTVAKPVRFITLWSSSWWGFTQENLTPRMK